MKIQWPLPTNLKPLWIEDECTRHDPDHETTDKAHLRLFNIPLPPLSTDLKTIGPHKHIRAYMDLGDAFIYFLDHCTIAHYCDGSYIYPPISD